MTLEDLTRDELLALVIEVIADGLPYDDAQVDEFRHDTVKREET